MTQTFICHLYIVNYKELSKYNKCEKNIGQDVYYTILKYTVNGTTFWDNDNGLNYRFPQVFDDFAVLPGDNFPVVLGTASLFSNTLHVNLEIQNLAFTKVVSQNLWDNNLSRNYTVPTIAPQWGGVQ